MHTFREGTAYSPEKASQAERSGVSHADARPVTSDDNAATVTTGPLPDGTGTTPAVSEKRGDALPHPQRVWRALAPQLAQRQSMRLWAGPDTGYGAHARPLAAVNRPSVPAALPLFDRRGRTTVLGLDLDTGRHGHHQVDQDLATLTGLLRTVAARWLTDRSSDSGGVHVWVPLSLASSHTPERLRPLLDALAQCLPSLDLTPMTNPRTGCLVGPGSATRGGGVRVLLTPLAEATTAVAQRCPAGTAGRLAAELGVPSLTRRSSATRSARDEASQPALSSASQRPMRPIPADVLAFACDGIVPDRRTPTGHRWSRSEAAQSVLAHAVLRGYSTQDIATRVRTHWTGLGDYYRKYRHSARPRLAADVRKAHTWAQQAQPQFVRDLAHQPTHTGGRGVREWLVQARTWAQHAPKTANAPSRWLIMAVLDALAYGAAVTATQSPELGRRWLALAAGQLPDSTVSTVLRWLRHQHGAPILWTTRAHGLRADQYTLVTPRLGETAIKATDEAIERTRIQPVHAAWHVLGHALREVWELLADNTWHRIRDLLKGTSAGRTQCYLALSRLSAYGLLHRSRGHVTRTTRALDEIARNHRLEQRRTRLLQRYRHERAHWKQLLTAWTHIPEPPVQPMLNDPLTRAEHEDWVQDVLTRFGKSLPTSRSVH